MKHNTNTLGYKLLSGRLKENRIHSEQLNKYLAGLLDADGSASFTFRPYNGKCTLGITFNLTQSFSNDPDGTLLKAIKDYYKIGVINYRSLSDDNNFSSIVVWTMSSADFLKLFNLVGKHLRIKGTHWESLVWLYMELKGTKLSLNTREEIRQFSKCSRKNSSWIKRPKHLSYAWLAGYFDGDGHYRFRKRKKFVKSYGKECNSNELCVQVSCDYNDKRIISKIVEDIGGTFHHHKDGHLVWKLALGKNSSKYALKLLKQMRKYSCLEKKYSVIVDMIQFHESYQQRLNKNNTISVSDSPISNN